MDAGKASDADVLRLAEAIKDNWALCEFLGKTEMEYIVAETIHAAARNLRERGEAFSFCGDGLSRDSPHFENRDSYAALRALGYLIEERRAGLPNVPKDVTPNEHGEVGLIFVAQPLVRALDKFLEKKRTTA